MPSERRISDRRRRVVYTSQHADSIDTSAAGRRARAKLREARQPSKAYGSRVHRRLRGRWFSLVPVKRHTLVICASIISAISLALTYAHYASVTWPSLVYRPEIARPLRLDQPDSFGRWATCFLLAACSGAALLIYQLRRYRNDDFRGQYRIWRIVVFTMLLASINSLVSYVDWSGSLLDLVFGRRVAFSGYDWLRIVLGLAGVVLAIRVIAEVYRSRWALAFTLVAVGFLALPEASKWQLIEIDNIQRWSLVTAAPLLGHTALFLGLSGYLRFLYREVRGIEDDESLGERWNKFRERKRRDREAEREEREYEAQRGRTQKRSRKDKVAVESEPEEEYEVEAESESDDSDERTKEPRKRQKRRWFGMRSRPPRQQAPESQQPEDESDDESLEEVAEEEMVEEEAVDEEATATPKKKRRFGLSWRKKKSQADSSEEVEDEPVADAEPQEEETEPEQHSESGEQSDDYIDPDEIDWSSLSKSERRRLRKKLKRQGRAA